MPTCIGNWLRTVMAFGKSSCEFWNVIDSENLDKSLKSFLESDRYDNKFVRNLHKINDGEIGKILSLCEKNSIDIVTFEDDSYPRQLRNIDNPPLLLFVYGNVECLNSHPAAAIVGARDSCAYSNKVAELFARELAAENIAVVSGCARGIDTAAHNGAIKAGGVTIAVLGCGILYDYPKNTWELKRAIGKHGAVISEFLPFEPPLPENFIVRNRIISGLSGCVLVAEASSHSGALNTAGHAAQQGREVFVIPPSSIIDARFTGQCELLLDGAQFALAPCDIVRFFK